jgi:hypothetical protein
MKLQFTYESTLDDYISLAKVTAAAGYSNLRKRTYINGSLWIILLGSAAWISLNSTFPLVTTVFLGAIGGYIYDLAKIRDRYWRAVYRSISVPQGKIDLTVTEHGLEETCEGIRSFAPWSCVTRYFISDHRIMIELASRLWAIVPKNGLSADSNSLSDLQSALEIYASNANRN